MGDRSGDASALLGMEGFVVLSETEEDGELWVLVETRTGPAGCPACGVRAGGHGRSVVQVRDLSAGGRPVRLVWRRRRWPCCDPDCGAKSFTEDSPLVEGSLTLRAARDIWRRVGEDGCAVAQVARDVGVGWAMACVRGHGEPMVDDPDRIGPTEAIGVDEHKMPAASKDHHTLDATSIVDLVTGKLLDVVPGRSADDVAFWLSQGTPAWRQAVSAVAIDPHRGYANGLLAQLPHALVTIDHFHSIKLANGAVDDVRRRVQQETTGHRGPKADPLYGVRRLLTRGWERLSERQRNRVFSALCLGDPDGEVAACVLGKELLRKSYADAHRHLVHYRLVRFYEYAAEAEVLHFHDTAISTGPVEAQNLITEKLRRIAHGMRDFENYRLRLLLHSGVEWDTRPTARIRGRHPRLVAKSR